MTKRRSHKTAFTLVEMMVIVVIIMILFALVISSIRRAGEQARKTRCAGNLKQIWSAMNMYISSNNESFPSANGWGGALYPTYLDDENIFDCPAKAGQGTALSPDYSYIRPVPSTPSTAGVLEDTNHNGGWVTLYKSGGIKIK